MKFKFMLFMVIAICLITPVSAEVINETTIQVHDFTDESLGYSQSGVDTSTVGKLNRFLCYNIESSGGLERIIFNVDVYSYSPTLALDQYGTTDITLLIGNVEVGSGIMEYERTGYNNITKSYNEISCSIEISNYDVSEFTGTQRIEFYETNNLNNKDYIGSVKTYPRPTIGAPEDLGEGRFYLAIGVYHPSASYNIQIDRKEDFYQHLTYSVDERSNIATAYYRENQLNAISLSSDDNVNYYNAEESIDIPTIVMVNKTYAEYKIWMPLSLEIKTIRIPEIELPPVTPTPEIPEEQTALIHNYVSDAVTRHLIGNGHTTTVTYDGNEEAPFTSTWPGGESHTTIDLTYGSSANLTISAVGYEDSQTYHFVFSSVDTTGIWLRAGTKPVNYVYLQPIATPSNTTAYATFEVQEQLSGEQYFYSSGAAVTVGSTTLITSGLGSCSFELEAGTYPYTVKKTGFQTVSGSFSLGASNQYISVKLPKIQTAPTPTDPIGQPGVDYPYSSIDPRSQAEESIGIIFQSLPAWASLCVIVVTISFIGWMSPRKGKR